MAYSSLHLLVSIGCGAIKTIKLHGPVAAGQEAVPNNASYLRVLCAARFTYLRRTSWSCVYSSRVVELQLMLNRVLQASGQRSSSSTVARNSFSTRNDPELVNCITGIFRQGGIEILLSHRSTTIHKSNDRNLPITLSTSTSTHSTLDIDTSRVLIAIGRIPSVDSLGLEEVGIRTAHTGHIIVSLDLSTRIDGVYALSDVNGSPSFTHVLL
ncbi:hypothetical protein CC78DRAFT_613106 [Lojkania enalia]|uniref:FAD/NAD(P)-binding domain-containing protein n=1 Tax=Lojkania enalia TaxID=147567 RepID=A0A9P4KIA9_9PLEO|nr:hypothetical protein CC78DRAFT_613106 [Didymosphaeria enalia]